MDAPRTLSSGLPSFWELAFRDLDVLVTRYSHCSADAKEGAIPAPFALVIIVLSRWRRGILPIRKPATNGKMVQAKRANKSSTLISRFCIVRL